MKKKDIRVLVVDDEREVADMLVTMLTRLGYSADWAYSGQEALDKIRQEEFQVIITDVMMPGINGMEVLETVKKQKNKTVVVLITGYATIESGVEAIEKGAYDYLPKPFRSEDLDLTLQRAVERTYGPLEP
jgi:DNA-binding NtrC family response regulator